MRMQLARIVSGVHPLVVVFACVAWALPWSWAIHAALVAYPLIQLNWWVFGGRCVLTVLEERLRAGVPDGALRTASGPEPAPNFVARLGTRITGRPVSNAWADIASYSVIWGGFALASLRLCLQAAP